MRSWSAPSVRGEHQRKRQVTKGASVLHAAIPALGIVASGIGLLGAPAPESVRYASPERGPMESSSSTSQVEVVPAGLQSGVGSPAQGSVITVGRAAQPLPPDNGPPDWESAKEIKTIDPDPGGKIQWDPRTGRIRVGDLEEDGHDVRGYAYRGGVVVAQVRRGGKGHFREAAIRGYEPGKKVTYDFRVCLKKKGGHDGYCNTTSTSRNFKPDKETDNCSSVIGPAGDYCDKGKKKKNGTDPGELYSTEKPNVPAPPNGSAPKVNDKPDKLLSEGHAKDRPAAIDESAGKILGWVTWTVYGACVLGFFGVAARMAIRHKRGEAGEHGASLAWVAIACIVPAAATYFVYLLIKPL